LQLEVCKEQIHWATTEKRTFLRQRIEIRLAMLHMQSKDYPAALNLIGVLVCWQPGSRCCHAANRVLCISS
jgi:26S proteasome regulatory subunit N6